MKCILLCAGYATRLYPLTKNFPKALLEIKKGRPLLNYIVDEVNTIDEIDEMFLVSNNKYFNYFDNWCKSLNNKKMITVLNDGTMSNDDKLGAIGDINFVIDKASICDDIIVIAGDNLFDYSLKDLFSYYHKKNSVVVCGKKMVDMSILKRVAVASVDDSNKIIDLVEKPEIPKGDTAVYATYIYPKNILPYIKKYLEEKNNPDAPGYLVSYLYKYVDIYVYYFNGNTYDVGTFESLEEVRKLYN